MLNRLTLQTKRRLAFGAVAVLVLTSVPFAQAHAGIFSFLFGDVLYSVIAKFFFGLSYLFSWLVAVVVAVMTWFVGVMLQLSQGLTTSPLVRFGYPVTLAFANLGFLIAIIVIAIMTILRSESYGVKQALWRLAAMALLVNFGLIIAKALLDVSDTVSQYFLNAISPGQSGFHNFAASLGGAFDPQKGFLTSSLQTTEPATMSTWGEYLTPITSVVFTLFSGIGIVISLGALVVMLIIRYLYLGYLLLMLPLAWASWIFPATKRHWNKWWDNFLKWTFFGPVVLFFLWLVIMVAHEMSNADVFHFTAMQSDPNNPVWSAIGRTALGTISPIIQQLLQTAVLVFLLLFGLGAASHLGITFADTAQSFTKNTWKGMGTWAQRRSRSLGGRLANRVLQQDQKEGRLDRWRKGLMGSNLLTRYTAGYAVQGLQRGVGYLGKDVVKEYEKEIGGKSPKELQSLLINASPEKRIAILKELVKRGEVDGLKPEEILSIKNRDLWSRNGENIGDVEKAFMRSVEAQEALNKGVAGEKDAIRELTEFWKKMKREDARKMQVDAVFGYKEGDAAAKRTANFISQAIATTGGYQLIPSLLAKAKGATQDNFTTTYPEAIDDAAVRQGFSDKLADNARLAGERKDHFKKALAHNALAEEGGGHHEGGGAPPAAGGGESKPSGGGAPAGGH